MRAYTIQGSQSNHCAPLLGLMTPAQLHHPYKIGSASCWQAVPHKSGKASASLINQELHLLHADRQSLTNQCVYKQQERASEQ
mmetsp:Transcript_5447/g.14724  ORF Transcript_5447/g.14724 Transcript_5447/m.14724 type:complete len:83 (-) Transcript_5447:1284-1532(-)